MRSPAALAHLQDRSAARLQCAASAATSSGALDGVAGLRMGQAEAQHFLGRQAAAAAAQREARRGVGAQVRPGIGRAHDSRRICWSAGWAAVTGRMSPRSSVSCMPCSHASNSGARAEAQQAPQVERVVERRALVVEHDVVGAGHAHDEGQPGGAEQRHQGVHVVRVGFGMVGVADVAAQRHAEQLAAEVVLEAGADDLLAVVEVLRPDEADDGVGQQRLERPRHAVGARLAGLLVDAVVGVGGQRAALAGLEVHDVVAEGAALQRQRRLAGPRPAAPGRCRSCGWPVSVPAIDWNTRSTGTPCSIICSVLVTWVRTQDWVGISSREMTSSSIRTRPDSAATLSLAGLMPITASPAP